MFPVFVSRGSTEIRRLYPKAPKPSSSQLFALRERRFRPAEGSSFHISTKLLNCSKLLNTLLRFKPGQNSSCKPRMPLQLPHPLPLLLLILALGASAFSSDPNQAFQTLPISSTPSAGSALASGATVASGKTLGPAQAELPRASSREIEKQIVDRILGEGYDKRIRPAGSGPYNASGSDTLDGPDVPPMLLELPHNCKTAQLTCLSSDAKTPNLDALKIGKDGPTIVKVNTLVRSISKIDDVTMEYSVQLSLRQEWNDDRLAFGKMPQYKGYGISMITLTEQERIWKPDLFFRNEKEGHFHKIIMPNVLLRIDGRGSVLYSIRISLVLACPMDLKYYPLDKQNCTIEMASYGYLDEDLKFLWKENNPVQIANRLNLPRFTLETHQTAYCTSRTTTGAYSCLRIDLIFKREFSYYLIQIYIPCCMLVIVSWVSFWLDPNAIPARVSLGVTTLLTMATQISGINASLPPVSYIKSIDVWTGVCLTFVFGALLEFALVNYASRSDQHKREMLTSTLTHTQQMRWREAAAAAAAAGVAPPSSPPADENSPSALFGKHRANVFFGNHFKQAQNYRPQAIVSVPNGPNEAGRSSSFQVKGPKRQNWCKMWLAKFPTRSKRIDVISRIFFPLKFAIFNLVYWITYLFREENAVA